MLVSICIPTYNRASHLANCLNSIILCKLKCNLKFQVCVSDNHSSDETEAVVKNAQLKLNIKYHKNNSNLGHARNFINVVSMADGEFIWLIGDDDLLMPHAIQSLYKLFEGHPDVDFFYVNSFHLTTDYIKQYPTPFDTSNLPDDMVPFSKWTHAEEMPFFQLIDPKISFDFLGGMFLSVFRKKHWDQNADILNQKAIHDSRTFSHFDNTFPHLKIFAKAFSNSIAYFNDQPLNVCLTGAREWAPMGGLVMSVRLIEALDEYRHNGLSFWQYIYCKNYALNNFARDLIYMMINKKNSGYVYINPIKLIFKSFLYPNFYMSFFYFIGRKIRGFSMRVFNYVRFLRKSIV
jgi:glycosyltransferase involved in cell wall biosynthesis